MNITFDDNLITGNKTIDSQHQELIDRIRQFVAACESGDSKIKAIKMLDYLDEYTNFHFQEEEELQKKVSYPEFSGHHAKHEEFKTSIQELYDYLNENEGPDDQFIEQVKRNVVDWLFQHIKICESTQWSQLQNEFPLYRFIQKIIPGKPAGFCTFLS